MEYTKLLVKLKRFDRAEVVLREIIEDKDQGGKWFSQFSLVIITESATLSVNSVFVGDDTQNDLVKVRAALSLTAIYEVVDTDIDERIRLSKEAYNRAERSVL